MKKGPGIRPIPAQQHLPESQVTEWILDSSGEYDEEGRSLARRRIRFSGSRVKALAQRRSWLATLAGDPPAKVEPHPAPDVAALAAALASVMTGTSAPDAVASLVTSAKQRRTVADFVKKEYFEHSKRNHDETTTPDRMKMLERYVLPVVGELTLEQANTLDTVEDLRKSLDAVIAPRTGDPLHSNYKNGILLAFSSVLTVAVDRTLLPRKVKVGLYTDRDLEAGQMLVMDRNRSTDPIYRAA